MQRITNAAYGYLWPAHQPSSAAPAEADLSMSRAEADLSMSRAERVSDDLTNAFAERKIEELRAEIGVLRVQLQALMLRMDAHEEGVRLRETQSPGVRRRPDSEIRSRGANPGGD